MKLDVLLSPSGTGKTDAVMFPEVDSTWKVRIFYIFQFQSKFFPLVVFFLSIRQLRDFKGNGD